MSIDKKQSFAGNMHRFSEQKIADAMQMAGKVLPASVVSRAGNMVTVSFLLRDIPFMLPQVTLPLFGPQYIRYPMQPGDRGSSSRRIRIWAVPADRAAVLPTLRRRPISARWCFCRSVTRNGRASTAMCSRCMARKASRYAMPAARRRSY